MCPPLPPPPAHATPQVLLSCASLGVPPPAPLLAQLQQRLGDQLGSPACSDQCLSNSLWALATLSCVPTKAWMDAVFGAVTPRAHAMDPQALSTILWAAVTLGQPLPPRLVGAIYATAGAAAEAPKPPGGTPPAESRQQQQQQWQQQPPRGGVPTSPAPAPAPALSGGLLHYPAQSLSLLIWSLSSLASAQRRDSLPPPPGFVAAFESAVLQQLPSFTAQVILIITAMLFSLSLVFMCTVPY